MSYGVYILYSKYILSSIGSYPCLVASFSCSLVNEPKNSGNSARATKYESITCFDLCKLYLHPVIKCANHFLSEIKIKVCN